MTQLQQLDDRVVDLTTRYDAKAEYELRPFIPTEENLGALEHDTATLQTSVERQGSTNPVATVLCGHFRECLTTLSARLRSDKTYPNRFVERISGRLNTLLYLDAGDETARREKLERLVAATPALLEAGAQLALKVSASKRDIFLTSLSALAKTVRQAATALPNSLPDAPPENLGEKLERVAAQTKELASRLKASPVTATADGDDYATTLRELYGIDIAELLRWYRDEVEACAEALEAEAKTFDTKRDALTILAEDLGPYDSPEELLPAMQGFVAQARDHALTHITLPEGERCDIWDVPEYLSDSYPWGGYFSGGNLLAGNLRGAVFLNTRNYRTVTRGWVLLNAVHECYPGHHAHFVKAAAADMPRSFKLAALTSPAAPYGEALCMRSETLMQDSFGEPLFRLFVRYRRLHTAVRIWTDLVLHHFKTGQDEAVNIYQRYLGFTESVARSQLLAQVLTPGYFTTYYYGLKTLLELEAESGMAAPAFSELAFSSGQISLTTFQELLALSETSRTHILGGFSTLRNGR